MKRPSININVDQIREIQTRRLIRTIAPVTTTAPASQPADTTLTALAGLDATAGLVEQTGLDVFTKRPIGVYPDDSTAVATTAFVTDAVAAGGGGGGQPLDAGLTSLAALTGSGVVTASATDTFAMRPIGVYPDDSTAIATTEFVMDAMPLPATGSMQGYLFNTTTTAPPASGGIRLNHATQNLATVLWLNFTNEDGVNIQTFVTQKLLVGDTIYIQDRDEPAKWQLYEVASAWTNSGTYATIPVTWLAGGSALSAQRVIMNREGGAAGAAGYALLAGATFTGSVVVTGAGSSLSIDKTGASANAAINVYSDNAFSASLYFRTGSETRWALARLATPSETGVSNVGSPFALMAYDDDGNYLGDVFKVTRSSRVMDFAVAPTIAGAALSASFQPLDADLTAIAALANTDSNFIVGNGSTWVAESGTTVRASLGLAIGSQVQAYDATLAALAGLDATAGLVEQTGADAFTKRLIGVTNASDILTRALADARYQAVDAELTAIAALAVTDSNFIVGNGTTWVAETGGTARASLGLGTSATVNTGTSGATIPLLNGTNTWAAQQTFSASPIAPTPAPLDNSFKVATTEYVDDAIAAGGGGGGQPLDTGLTSLAGLTGAGLVEASATDTFAMRALGVGASTSVPTRADADARYGQLAVANTWTASQVVSGSGSSLSIDKTGQSANASINIYSDNAFSANLFFRTGVESRWAIGRLASPSETGSANVGSPFGLLAYDDDGNFLGNAFTVTRGSQVVNFDQVPTIATVSLDSKYEALGVLPGINTQTGTSYTLVLADKGKMVEMNNASANVLTVPPNSSVAFAVGTRIDITQMGAGQTTITPGGGVTIRQRESKLKIAGLYGGASLYKRATDEWVLFGDVSA